MTKGPEFSLKVKLTYNEERVDEEHLDLIDDGEMRLAKISTNVLNIEKDRKDQREIKGLKQIKVIYKLDKGCLILMGNLQCSFTPPFGGELYVFKSIIDENADFDSIKAIECAIEYTNQPYSIETTKDRLLTIANHPDFVFNINQFDEFMDLFKYYMKLSNELNNDVSYDIRSYSKPYYYISNNSNQMNSNDYGLNLSNPLLTDGGIIKGYKITEYEYELLSNDMKSYIDYMIDIKIAKKDINIKKLAKMSDNLYLSNQTKINDTNIKEAKAIEVLNISVDKDNIILSVYNDSLDYYKYINVYDMGQKIKIESIDNSLRLINQGNTGKAIELIKYLIGDSDIPNLFDKSVKFEKQEYIKNLNPSQREAFLKAIDGSPVTLIKGPPGTGKTHVINAITQYITKELKEKVIISSQTHVAIDNVLDKLMSNHDLIIPNRITNKKNKYSGKEIDKTLFKTWGVNFNKHNELASNKKLRKKIEEQIKNFKGIPEIAFSQYMIESDYSVIGATTTTSAIGGRKGLDLLENYNWLIIDEVSKCPITEVLRYLPYIEKIIMVGDDYQLSPLLEFNKEDVEDLASFDEDKFQKLQNIYEKSVFAETMKKAEKSERLVLLNENYRSKKDVLRAYNIFYDNQLINMRDKVNPETVHFKDLDWLEKNNAIFVDVKYGKEVQDLKSNSRYNVEEIRATVSVLRQLINHTINPKTVSVSAIFPYAAQIEKFTKEHVDLINEAIKVFKSFNVDTVDAFQGKESDIVLVNTVVTDRSRRNFLSDFRRINVSMSRARDKLIIFGNPQTLSNIEMKINDGYRRKYFGEIISDIKRFGKIVEFNYSKGGLVYENTSKSKIKLAN